MIVIIVLALPPSAKNQKNMGRTLGCGHFTKSGTTNFFFGGGRENKMPKILKGGGWFI